MTKLQELLFACWFLSEAMRLKDEERHTIARRIADTVATFDTDTPEQFARAIVAASNKGN